MEKTEPSYAAGRGVKGDSHFQKQVPSLLKKLNFYHVIQLSAPECLPKEIKAHVRTEAPTQMSQAGLFVTAPTWTRINGHPWVSEGTSCGRSLQGSLQIPSQRRRYKILPHATTCMSLKVILLHGTSQSKKYMLYYFNYTKS